MRPGRKVILALLACSLAGALAGPAHAERGIRGLFGLRSAVLEQEESQRESPLPPQAAQQPRQRSFLPDASGYGAQPENMAPEGRLRQGRLTPEERRALRRQIDEVGHDIYTPRR